ncbi:MAG TPA: glycosyltransferase family 4 protein [Solirubrobacteraceae bacterium]|jgi:glycosyltransferase involved in cell wall biosynthesis
MRVLFFNEGNLGTHILGQGQLEQALRIGLADAPEVQAHFAGLTPMGRLALAAAVRSTAPLARAGLDFRTLRWHTVQAVRARRALREELRSWPADVAHVHSHSIALAMGGTMRAMPVALSVDVTVRDWWAMPAWRPPQRYAPMMIEPSCVLERRALRHAAVVLAWTEWARKAVQQSAPDANVVEHHPGIDLTRYRPAARRERDRPRVLFVGGRFVEKGGEDLLHALGDKLGHEVDLDLVTPVEVPARAGVTVHRLKPSDPKLLELQQQADLFCLPTHGDAAPWAVLEAMACGTPVLSTHIGGIPDMLEQGQAGVLVAHGDRAALSEALSALLANPEQRASLAASARERCEQHYDARQQFARLVDHLAQAREDRRNGRRA